MVCVHVCYALSVASARIKWENLTCWRRLCVDGLSHRILLHFTWTCFLFLCRAIAFNTILHESFTTRQHSTVDSLLCILVRFFFLPLIYQVHITSTVLFRFMFLFCCTFFPILLPFFSAILRIYRLNNIDTYYHFCGHWEFFSAWILSLIKMKIFLGNFLQRFFFLGTLKSLVILFKIYANKWNLPD